MSLPTPKEALKKLAEAQDKLAETLTKPVKELASNIGLPEPPELPKASELVEALPEPPELPSPEALLSSLPGAQETTSEEVSRMKIGEEKIETRFKMKIV